MLLILAAVVIGRLVYEGAWVVFWSLPAAAAAFVIVWDQVRAVQPALLSGGLASLLVGTPDQAAAAVVLAVALLAARDGRMLFLFLLALPAWWLGPASGFALLLGAAIALARAVGTDVTAPGARIRVANWLTVAAAFAFGLWFQPASAIAAGSMGLLGSWLIRHPVRLAATRRVASQARWAALAPALALLGLAGLGRVPDGAPLEILGWGWGAVAAGLWLVPWAAGWNIQLRAGPGDVRIAVVSVAAGASILVMTILSGNLGAAAALATPLWFILATSMATGLPLILRTVGRAGSWVWIVALGLGMPFLVALRGLA